MATYKVPQNVEAEDKLIGFLSFRQFIFIIVAIMCSAAAWFSGQVNILLAIPFILPGTLFFILGLYQPKDQPVETKLVAMVNFFFRPRKRIWNRDGISEHLIITAPKKIEVQRSDHRSRAEVRSQLKTLAQIVDTRGWSSKKAEIQLPGSSGTISISPADDRLMDFTQLQSSQNEAVDIHQNDDVMDDQFNQTAQRLGHLADEATKAVHERALQSFKQKVATSTKPQTAQGKKVKYQAFPASMHQASIQPLHGSVHSSKNTPPPAKVEHKPSIVELSQNEDLSVSGLASKAKQAALEEDEAISLH